MGGSLKKIQGYDSVNGKWVEVSVDEYGKIIISDITFPTDYPDAAANIELTNILTELQAKLDFADLLFDEDGNLKVYDMSAASLTVIGQLFFTPPDPLTVDTNVTAEGFAGGNLTITEVYVSVKVAPTGSSLIIDVNKNGTTIFTNQANRPTIAIGETSDTSGTPDVTALTKNDKITIDIDQIGSTLPGETLTVILRFTQEGV